MRAHARAPRPQADQQPRYRGRRGEMPEWVMASGDLTPAAKVVLAGISRYGNQAGHRRFPTEDTLARVCALSVRSVKSAVRQLEQAKAVEVGRERAGRSSRNFYRLAWTGPGEFEEDH